MRELESGRTVAKNKARKRDIVFLIMYIPPPPPILKGHGHRVLVRTPAPSTQWVLGACLLTT